MIEPRFYFKGESLTDAGRFWITNMDDLYGDHFAVCDDRFSFSFPTVA